jgi:uncharacterized protein (DUF2147 family)
VIAEQMDLAAALEARDQGTDQALANAAGDWKERAYAAIEQLAATGEIFCADDVRLLVGDPDAGQHHNLIGAIFGAARAKNLIEFVGYVQSKRVIGHGNRIVAWVGKRDRARTVQSDLEEDR